MRGNGQMYTITCAPVRLARSCSIKKETSLVCRIFKQLEVLSAHYHIPARYGHINPFSIRKNIRNSGLGKILRFLSRLIQGA